jgi:hypothetical protein
MKKHHSIWDFTKCRNIKSGFYCNRGKPKCPYVEKNLSQYHSVQQNSICNALEMNLGLHGAKPATNCWSHGTANNILSLTPSPS